MTPAASQPMPSVPAASPHADFPTRLPPMLVKELRQGLRTRGFVGALIVFQVVMMLLMVVAFLASSTARGAMRTTVFRDIDRFFWILTTVQLLVVTPLRALGGLRMELEARSLDLLMLTRLSAWRIVLGKWVSLVAQSALLLVAILPYGVLRYFGGSVDLVRDALICLVLLGGSAVITALALWTSCLPRAFHLILPVAAFFVVTGTTNITRSTGSPFSIMFKGESWVWWVDAAVLTLFFLLAAVRHIAPPSDNHALHSRLLSWVPLLLSVGCAVGLTAQRQTFEQLGFSIVLLAFSCISELVRATAPMPAHCKAWVRRGDLGWLAGRFFLPGWQSGLLYTLASAVLLLIVLALMPFQPGQYQNAVLLVMLGAAGLVFPVLVTMLLPSRIIATPAAVFVVVLGALSIFAPVAMEFGKQTVVEAIACVLPVSSFWMMVDKRSLGAEVTALQCAVSAVVVGFALYQSRGYWARLETVEQRLRQ